MDIKSHISAVLLTVVLCFAAAPFAALAEEPEVSSSQTQDGKNESLTDEKTNSSVLGTDSTDQKTEEEKNPHFDSSGRPILGEGETGILIDSASGAVLYEHDSQKQVYPASTTKIMTALLAVEAVEAGTVRMDEQIEITADMLSGLSKDGSSINLVEGEIISFEYLLKGLMVASGNDAAMAIAYRISSGEAAFAEKMNQRAQELGMSGTHFVNPHGFHDENHYTTAADMASLAREAMKHEGFRNLADIVHIKIPPTNKTEKQRYYINSNGLLSAMRYKEYYYKDSIGIKTGHTSQAGNCLVSAAVRDGLELIGAVFGGKDVKNSHTDSVNMLNYGFDNYRIIDAVTADTLLGEVRIKCGKTKDSVALYAASSVKAAVPKDVEKEDLEIKLNLPDSVYAPVRAEQKLATASVIYGGQVLGTCDLLAAADIERSFFWPAMALGEILWGFSPVRYLVYAVLVLAVVFVFFAIRNFIRELRRAQKSRRQRDRHK